jgi:hypothetical protein
MSNPHVPTDADLDTWTQHVIETHFDPETGTPYWLEWENERNMNVRSAVDGFDDLQTVFEPFDADVLRSLDVKRFVPQGLDGDRRVYETSGTTGRPKRVIMRDYWREQTRWAVRLLDEMKFPTGNVLMLGPPGGANNAGVFVQHLAHEWDALPYHINMDPRWAKHLGQNAGDDFDAYIDHLLDQAENILKTQDISVLFTTSRFLEHPRVRDLIATYDIEGVYHGGTHLDPDTHAVFQEDWYTDIAFVGEYGNTLMGVAQEPAHLRSPGERDYRLDYAPCYPYFVPEVIDDTGERVDYGERGRVRLTVLNEEFFIPLLYERDEATRVRGLAPLNWDWIRDPGPPTEETDTATEGVY